MNAPRALNAAAVNAANTSADTTANTAMKGCRRSRIGRNAIARHTAPIKENTNDNTPEEMETYKYQLRRGGRKEICPNCGQRRFVPYVLTEDNETIVNPDWGRCDRENSCGYWMKPNGNPVIQEPKPRKPETPMWIEPFVTTLFGNSLAPYAEWLIGKEKGFKAFMDYNIGTAYDGGCIFVQVDVFGKMRAGKIIRYKDGHRVKDGLPVRWLHKDKFYKRFVHGDTLKQCFFGEHLLPMRPDSPVAVVESEKTALLMSAIRPEYVWLATGGSCGLQNAEKTKVLERRDVTLFPDNGMYLKWRQIAMPKGWAVNEECLPANEHVAAGYDILDLYEWWLLDAQHRREYHDEIR